MKLVGIFFILVGLVWGIVAYNMSTIVTTEGEGIGEVHNLGLMEIRRNHLMFSGLSVICGVLLLGFGSFPGSTSVANLKKCPLCAEQIQPEAKKCRYCGGDLPESWSSPPAQEPIVQPIYNNEEQLVIRMCPSCRFTNNGSAKECSRCGTILPA